MKIQKKENDGKIGLTPYAREALSWSASLCILRSNGQVKGEFMGTDFKILFLLVKRSIEFSKLEFADQKILVWFLANKPEQVKGWVNHLDAKYSAEPKPVNGVKLYDDVKDLLPTPLL